jgi:hypothetical protein
LISSDWNIGMAMFQPYNVWRVSLIALYLDFFSLPKLSLCLMTSCQ